jgi:integrase
MKGLAEKRIVSHARRDHGGYLGASSGSSGESPSDPEPIDPIHGLLSLLHRALEEYVNTLGPNRGARSITHGYFPAAAAAGENVGALVERLLIAKRADGLSDRYIETLRSHLRRFAAALDGDIGSITVSHIERWLRSLGTGARARNNIRASIITLFHFARKEGYLRKGEATEADEIAKAKDRGGQIGILTPTDFAPVMARAPQKAGLFLALGAFAGLRSSETLRLEWDDINLDRHMITVAPEKAKTATRRLVPIQPNLHQWLERYQSSSGSLFGTRRDADGAIRFVKSCRVEWPNNALRHSYATYRLALTADVARVALEMGNSPQKLIRHYRELADEKDGVAWFSISPTVACFECECERPVPKTSGLNS